MKVVRLDAPKCAGGENPLWDAARQVLHYIDNTGRKVHTYDPATSGSRTLEMPAVITTLALRASGGAVVTLRSGVHLLDLETGALELLHPLPDPPPHVFNDGKVDARGRFVIGASTANFAAPGPDGGLFKLDPDRTLSRLAGDIHFSNGPCWSPDGATLYFSDSWLSTAYAYDYDVEHGVVGDRRTFIQTGDLGGLPDGATVDEDGLYWAAIFRGGKVAAYRPDGRLERVIDMPVKLPSSVAFGGPNLDQLYVTSIAHDAVAEAGGASSHGLGEHAGSLFLIEGLGARGRPEHLYAG